jgi:hypothetical protein
MSAVTARVPEPLKVPAKHVWGRLLSIASARAHRGYDLERTLLVLGSPRSGTTWLMNVVSRIPGTCPIFEPWNGRHDPVVARLLDEEFPRIDPREERPALETFLRLVLSGRHLTRWSSAYASPAALLRADRFVVKFVRAMRAAGWLSARFPRNRAVVLLRHPCAVVRSMISSGGRWNEWGPEQIVEPIRRTLGPEVEPILAGLRTREELLAAFWSADAIAAVRETSPAGAFVLTYEELVREPEPTLARLFGHLREPVPERALEEAARPSETANPGAAIRGGRDPLTAWRKGLEPEQVRRIVAVVRSFGIDYYGEDAMPDLRALAAERRAVLVS